MDYNEIKLKAFTKYLLEKNPALLSKVSPLGISEEYGIFSTAEEDNHYSPEDWNELIKHWEYYLTNVYTF